MSSAFCSLDTSTYVHSSIISKPFCNYERHNCLNTSVRIILTHLAQDVLCHALNFSSNSASSSRSSVRKCELPADITTNGSWGARLVNCAGIER